MSARGFGPVVSAGAVVGAALCFYLISLNVASERAALEEVETKIAMTQRDIRLLQTEIGTRGRLAQLERWNVKFIRLSAPTADQFVEGGFQLATLVAPQRKPAIDAPVVYASAPLPSGNGQAQVAGDPAPARPASEIMHVASYSVPDKKVPALPKAAPDKPAKPVAGADKAAARQEPATKPAKAAMADPLAPLPTAKPKAKASSPAASGGGASTTTPKARVTD